MRIPCFKNILVGLVAEPPLPSAALDFAFDLAARCDAHVTVEVDATDDMPVGAMNYEAASAVAAVNDRFEADASAAVDRVRAMAQAAGLSCRVLSWTATYSNLTRNFAALGRTHDLSILDAGHGPGLAASWYFEAALFETGRPVVIVPAGIERCAFQRGLVAWDGSVEAARAVNDALPFLRCMEHVEIVSVEGAAQDRLAGLVLHLGRHGIAATGRVLDIGTSVGRTLIDHVHATHPDLVVMGGYSHARLREWILGGTTRAMLIACPAVLSMSR